MSLEIYLDPCTINSRKVLAGFDLMKVDYNLHFISFFEGKQKDPDYVKNVNPSATVPAAVDGDLHITESNAILMYAADKVGSSAYPKDLKQRAAVNRWLFWEASVWFGSCYIYLIQNVVQPMMGAKPDQAALDAEAPNWNKLAGIMNEQLGKTKFIATDELTIADFAIAASMHLWRPSKMPVEKYENLHRWWNEIENNPSWKKTQPAVEKALGENK